MIRRRAKGVEGGTHRISGRRRRRRRRKREGKKRRSSQSGSQAFRRAGDFLRVSSKPMVLTKGETHTHFGACIPPPPPPPPPIPPIPPPPTPAAFAPADAEALRTSRYCISAAAALEYERDLPRGGGCGERGGWVVDMVEEPRGVSVERVR